jgi:outer membrane receptor protein involved in Fe transport
LELHSAIFFDRWDDIQTDQYLPSGLSYTANVGDGRNAGLETELAFQAAQGLALKADALFDAPAVTRVEPTFAAKVTSGLPGVPNTSFGGLAVYERPLSGVLTWVLTGEFGYVGRSRLTFDPSLSPWMGGYVTSELSAQIKSPRWRAALYLSNPTNEAGDTFAFGNPFSFGQVRQVTPLRPRTLGLRFSAGF